MDPLSGVIGGASLIANMFGQNKANAQNLRIAQEANRANMNMFHYNLAYNSPSSQKARLKAAGLNSDLIYGNGVGGLVNTQVPEMRQSAPMQNIAAAFDPLTAAQIANINADTKLKEKQGGVASSQEEINKVNKRLAEFDANDREAYNNVLRSLQGGQSDGIEFVDPNTGQKKTVAIWNKGSWDALQRYISTRSVQDTLSIVSSAAGAEIAQNKLRQAVADAQGKNKEVLSALANMPLEEYKRVQQSVLSLIETVKEQQINNKYLPLFLEKQLKSMDAQLNSSFSGLLEKFDDPNMSLGDKLLATIGFVVDSALGHIGPVSFGKHSSAGITINNNK